MAARLMVFLMVFLMVYLEYLCCHCIVRHMNRRKRKWCGWLWQCGEHHKSQSALVGWLFSWVPLSFMGSLNVSLRSQLYLLICNSAACGALAAWCVLRAGLASGVQGWNEVGRRHGCAESSLQRDFQWSPCQPPPPSTRPPLLLLPH